MAKVPKQEVEQAKITDTYTNANVEWWYTSSHGTVALRPGGGQVSHFVANPSAMLLAVAVSAGMMGKTVDFSTSGSGDDFWHDVQITNVR